MFRKFRFKHLCITTLLALPLALQAQTPAATAVEVPSTLVMKPTLPALITFTVRLAADQDEAACREWMADKFKEVKVTFETQQSGADSKMIARLLTSEKQFMPPFKDADELHASFGKSPCGKGRLILSSTQALSSSDLRRGR